MSASFSFTPGVVQFACTDDLGENIATASRLARDLRPELYGILTRADGGDC